jgi:IS5 family transposase
MPGDPYDEHTLYGAIEQVEILTERRPKEVFVDRGYRSAKIEGIEARMSGCAGE